MISILQHLLLTAPYRMVFVSVSAALIFLFIVWFATNIYPRKRIPYMVLLIGLSILPLISILRPGTYESGDLTLHTARLMSFYKNLQEGVLIPRWAGELNATYGYALFNFYYPLPYYISSFYHFLGFSSLDSIKLLLITSFIFSGIFMFLWLKMLVSERAAFLGAVFYIFAPYHLVDTHFRVAIGEVTYFVFLPLSFLILELVLRRKSLYLVLLLGASIALQILSHAGVALIGFVLMLGYIVVNQKDKKSLVRCGIGVILGLLFSAFYSIPAIFEAKYAHQQIRELILGFPNISELLYSKWRSGFLFQGPNGELSYLLGYSHLLVLIFSIAYFIKTKSGNYRFPYFLISTLTLIFFLTPASLWLWLNLPLIKNMLLTTRLLLVISFTLSTLAALMIEKLNNTLFFRMLLLIAIGSTILNWGNRKNVPEIKDGEITSDLPFITAQTEGAWNAVSVTRPVKDLWQTEIPQTHIEKIDGKLDIRSEYRTTIYHSYNVVNSEDGIIKENTYFFPGWKLIIDGQEEKIITDSQKYPGIITFTLKKGSSKVDLIFTDTPIRKFSFYLSFISLFVSGILLLIKRLSFNNSKNYL